MKHTADKNCYCLTCKKELHHMGVAMHKTMHRRKKENCKIRYTSGDVCLFEYEDIKLPYLK